MSTLIIIGDPTLARHIVRNARDKLSWAMTIAAAIALLETFFKFIVFSNTFGPYYGLQHHWCAPLFALFATAAIVLRVRERRHLRRAISLTLSVYALAGFLFWWQHPEWHLQRMLRNASRLELRTYSYDQQDEQSRWKSMFEIDDSVAIQELAKSVELTTDPWELLYYFTLHGDYQVVAYDDSGNRIGYFDVINRGEAVTWRLQPEGKPSPVSQRLATDQFTSVAFRQALNKLILKTLVEKRETIALHHYTYMLREVSLPEAMPLLAAEIPTADPLQRKAIVYHLTAYEGDRTTIAPLLQLARDPDDEVRKTALYALRPFIHEPRVHVFLQSFNLQAEPSADARAIVQGHRGEIVSIF